MTLKVFITVDTEMWPAAWPLTGVASCAEFMADFQRDFYGRTPDGDFGVQYQINLLNRYGLKAVFFVEALFASRVGLEPLKEMIEVIQKGGHEVQLHLHTEWLSGATPLPLSRRTGHHLRDFSEDDQAILIAQGLENLRACGVPEVRAFRAGNFGANNDTFHALARNNIIYDSSYNCCYLSTSCRISADELLIQPCKINGVYEFPVTTLEDLPGHRRPLHLGACSKSEMIHALEFAWMQNWHSFVIVSHSFELIRRRIQGRRKPKPDVRVVHRFRQLCEFLSSNRDRFSTAVFSGLSPETIPALENLRSPKSNIFRTAHRCVEQLLRKFN